MPLDEAHGPSIPQAMQIAVAHHQAGRLPEAEGIYRQVLAIEPGHAQALHLLGVIAHQHGENELAVQLIGEAVDRSAADPYFRNNLALALQQLSRYDEALASYDRSLALKPDYAEAWNNRGSALQKLERRAEALASYDQSLALKPGYAEALCNRGSALRELARHDDALASLERALAIKPDFAEAFYNRGNTLQDLERYDEALASYERALSIRPQYADAWDNRGGALHELKRYAEALDCFEKALSLKPENAEAFYNRGSALHELERYDEALASYDKALSIKPGYAAALGNRGNTLQALQRYDEALANYDEALSLRPDDAEVLSNRGCALRELKRHSEALANFAKALSLKPDHVEALNNLALALQELKRHDEALVNFAEALAIAPEFAHTRWNESLCRLQMGDFERGWQAYEWRWKWDGFTSVKRDFPQPLWLGKETIAGKTILLHAEQGLGDTIQFARYAQAVAGTGARVILEVQPALRPLLSIISGACQVLSPDEPLPDFDFHCPLLSLPLALGTTLETVPASIPYLSVDEGAAARWRATLAHDAEKLVGVCWRGNPANSNDRKRSIRFAEFAHLLTLPGIRFVSLQKELTEEEQALAEKLSPQLSLMHPGEDFKSTAEMIAALDLVISVDTAWAHWAGALGKPVWILLRSNPDWRWLLDRDDSPWYPTARLFRQTPMGDWSAVVERASAALTGWLAQTGQSASPGTASARN